MHFELQRTKSFADNITFYNKILAWVITPHLHFEGMRREAANHSSRPGSPQHEREATGLTHHTIHVDTLQCVDVELPGLDREG